MRYCTLVLYLWVWVCNVHVQCSTEYTRCTKQYKLHPYMCTRPHTSARVPVVLVAQCVEYFEFSGDRAAWCTLLRHCCKSRNLKVIYSQSCLTSTNDVLCIHHLSTDILVYITIFKQGLYTIVYGIGPTLFFFVINNCTKIVVGQQL